MLELVTTGIMTVASLMLFGYWFRCAWRLLRLDGPLAQPVEAAQIESRFAYCFISRKLPW